MVPELHERLLRHIEKSVGRARRDRCGGVAPPPLECSVLERGALGRIVAGDPAIP